MRSGTQAPVEDVPHRFPNNNITVTERLPNMSMDNNCFFPVATEKKKPFPWGAFLIVILVVVSVWIGGKYLLHGALSRAYYGTFPFKAVNHLISGQKVHPLSHYVAHFTRIYECVFVAVVIGLSFGLLASARFFRWLDSRWAFVVEGLLVVISGAVVLYHRLYLPVGLYDEGLILTGGWQVSLGLVPYRDFYNIYGPGQDVMLGALFLFFGKSLEVARLYDLCIQLAIVLIFWAFLRRHLSCFIRFVAHFSFVCWLVRFGSILYPVYPVLLCHLAALWVLSASCGIGFTGRRYFAAGMFAGVAVLFRHDIGTLFAGLLFVLLWWKTFTPRNSSSPFCPPLSFALGVLPLPLIVYGSLAVVVPLPLLWFQLVQLPFCVFPAYRCLPYPSWKALVASPHAIIPFYLFPFVLLVSIGLVLAYVIQRRCLDDRQRAIMLLLLLSLAGLPQALGRSDFPHLISLALPAIGVFFLVLPACKGSFLLAFAFLCYSVADVWHPVVNHAIFPSTFDAAIPKEVVALREVVKNCPSGPIFVGNRMHNRLVVNQPGLYFFLDRLPGTFYFHFDPGVVTTAPVQEIITHDMEINKVNTIVLWDEPPHNEPNRSSEDSQVRILDSFIRSNNCLFADIAPYSIWTRFSHEMLNKENAP